MMKEKHLKWACIGVFICIVALFLSGFAIKSEGTIVKELLERRTDIMRNVLSGKITYEEGKAQLNEIEKDKLYRDDLESLQKYLKTDIDTVEDMQVINIEKKSHLYDMTTFRSEIYWTYYGAAGKYDETIHYLVGVSNVNDEYKLVSLKIQNTKQ